jgi:hypothetical protein
MRRRILAAAAAAPVLLLGAMAPSFADDIYNDVDDTIDAAAETMSLTVGGADGSTTLHVTPTNGDGKSGCNLNQNNGQTLTVAVTSSQPLVATVTPALITFGSCGATPALTVHPLTTGSAQVTLTPTINTTGATFDFGPATFDVSVGVANTAPTVTVGGVAQGGSYDKGSVPDATCEVTDAEDGPSSFAATLSSVSGPNAADGIGSQTADCSYTDGGGLTDTDAATYDIVDPSKPGISYALTPATADGANGWWTGSVDVDWTVDEAESPGSLATTDCDDFTLSADQAADTYTCSADSAGGHEEATTEDIKIDGTKPAVDLTGGPADGATYELGVDTVPAAPTCDATDDTSDVDGDGCVVDGWSDQLGSHTVTATATDNAGNSRTVSVSYDVVDPSAPEVGYDLTPAVADGANGWWTGNVDVDWSVTEAETPGSLTSTDCDDFSLTADQAAATYTCSADSAGGHAEVTTEDIKIDGTDPTLDLTDGPADGATYYLNLDTVPAATCEADDVTSGVNGDGCVIDGWSDQLGSHTVTATVTDQAGNSADKSRSYEVIECNFENSAIGTSCAPTCDGLNATIKGASGSPIVGTEGDDVIVGTFGDDEIDGLGGDDRICAFDGVDTVDGGDGADRIFGGVGADEINGGAGTDTLRGGGDDDTLNGGADDDTLIGDAGGDTLNGDEGADTLTGASGTDTADGGAGNDTLMGGTEADVLSGGADDDIVNGEGGDDTLNGGDGVDTLTGSTGNDTMNGDGGADVVNGNLGDDQVDGGEGDDTLSGGAGADGIAGAGGNDTVKGNSGNDTIEGGDGADNLQGHQGVDSITGGEGNDSLYGGEHADTMYGSAGDDLLNGGTGNDQMYGEAGNDSLYGNAGADHLFGGDDDDRLVGGPDSDTLNGGAGTNSLVQ